MTIKVLTPRDWREYKDIRLESLKSDPTAYARPYREEARFSSFWWKKQLADPLRAVYVAKIGGEIAGTAGFWLIGKTNAKHMATLVGVFVKPDYRARGVATSLMKRILTDLHKNKRTVKMRLSVNEPQKAAKKLYQKFGFKQVGLARKEIKIGNKYYDQAQMELIFNDKL